MKRAMKLWAMALAVLLTIGAMAPQALAAQKSASATLGGTVTVTGGDPVEGATATFEIRAITENAPMPESSRQTISLQKGVNPFGFTMDYHRVGVYEYVLKMVEGTYYLPGHDDGEFRFTVTITNSKDYKTLDSVVCAYDSGIKCEMAYELPLRELSVSKRWVDQDSVRPGSIRVDLYCGKEKLDTITLSHKTGWQGRWQSLDVRRGEYTVKESKVPAGYTASYREDPITGVWTITNTGSLLQTGQLNWPIPVLCCAGSGLILMGMFLLRRKEETDD